MEIQLHSISSGKVVSATKVENDCNQAQQQEIIEGMVDRALKQSPDIFSVVELDDNSNVIMEFDYEKTA